MTARHASTHAPLTGSGSAACRRGVLGVAIACALLGGIQNSHAAASGTAAVDGSGPVEADFDRSMLSGAGQNTTDLSRFERGNPVLPGTYRVDIYLNDLWVGRSDVRFAVSKPDASATACISAMLLEQLGLPLDKLSGKQRAALANADSCMDFESLIPGARLTFDQSGLRLDASVPQAWLGHRPRGYVSPENWDAGVPAMLLNYNFNSYRSSNAGFTQTSAYLGLRTGVNLGLWHLRQDSALNWQSGVAGQPSHRQWQNIDTYVRRDLPTWHAALTLGDAYTSGDLFDSIRLRGVSIATDDRMLPNSLRGYAPTVRGVAESNAKVSVRQNGVVIYETTVSPGPFVIDDLYPTGYGGDLQVTVTEANGRVNTFSVPFASVPQLLRPGVSRFNVALGQLRDTSMLHTPLVAETTVQHGFTNLLTGYAGLVGTRGYSAAQLGSALNTRYGALALDLTTAHTVIPGQSSQTGQSLRLSYSKTLPETNTSLTVATYRYSTSGYLGLRDAMLARDYARGGLYPVGTDPLLLSQLNGVDPTNLPGVLTPAQRNLLLGNSGIDPITGQFDRQRSRFDLTLNQQLGTAGGALYASGSARDYWNRTGTDLQFQLGYNNRFHRLSYSVSATRVRDLDQHYRNQYFISFSLPLGERAYAPNLTGNLNRDDSGRALEQLTVNGSAGVDNRYNYGATASHGEGAGTAASIYGGYRSSYAQLNASYGSGSDYSQASLGASGAIVAYPGGISFGQSIGDTVGIVVAPDAAGARVNNTVGLRVDHSGHALVPYLTPYNLNTVELDPKGMPLNVQLEATSAQVAPYAGSVVMLRFKTKAGRMLIVQVRMADGNAVPFGSEVVNAGGQVLGVVGQAGHILLRGVGDAGALTVRWKNDAGDARTCTFDYRAAPATAASASSGHTTVNATCEMTNSTIAKTDREQP